MDPDPLRKFTSKNSGSSLILSTDPELSSKKESRESNPREVKKLFASWKSLRTVKLARRSPSVKL